MGESSALSRLTRRTSIHDCARHTRGSQGRRNGGTARCAQRSCPAGTRRERSGGTVRAVKSPTRRGGSKRGGFWSVRGVSSVTHRHSGPSCSHVTKWKVTAVPRSKFSPADGVYRIPKSIETQVCVNSVLALPTACVLGVLADGIAHGMAPSFRQVSLLSATSASREAGRARCPHSSCMVHHAALHQDQRGSRVEPRSAARGA